MAIGRGKHILNTVIERTNTKQVLAFKYLGTTFTEDGNMDKENNIRCSKANQVG